MIAECNSTPRSLIEQLPVELLQRVLCHFPTSHGCAMFYISIIILYYSLLFLPALYGRLDLTVWVPFPPTPFFQIGCL
ncbi:uncharacterized protein BDZ99DRAFT_228829 [Mytilinidion resinicola]|uniref:Uncharacterized protein n=1 Tax=Mytilinidion resinicola TaxID=574789 RepID=A0A6A6YZS0_9PEZI|nr:uncharacterized protein BDZ99DRAFT_228829 [Mytilinidion resinicola]KAF2813943.1 hypothetical protein BDZ99DRAFT_228829 [Mytilinidion resinicola]